MPSTSTRLTWIDTVKGAAIILVVLMHVATAADGQSWYDPRVLDAMAPLRTVRMPLFFAMSGYFLLRRIDRPWRWQLRNRPGPFLWLFLLWSALWALASLAFPWNDYDYTVISLLAVVFNPEFGPWYIYALALYFVAVKLMRPLPVWLQFIIGAAISLPVAFDWITVDNFAWERTLTHFLIFQFGAYGHRIIAAIAERASLLLLVIVGALWSAGFGALYLTGSELSSPWWLPLTVLGMTMGIIAASLLAQYAPWLHLDWFGRHTLPIYLLHIPVIGVLLSIDPGIGMTTVTAVVGTVVLTILAVVGSLAIWRVLRPIPGLFTAPWTGDGANTRSPRISETPSGRHRSDAQKSSEKAGRPAR